MAQHSTSSATTGDNLAQRLLATSPLSASSAARDKAQQLFSWQKTSVPAALQPLVAELVQDGALQRILAALRWRFLTCTETRLPESALMVPTGFAVSQPLTDLLLHYCVAPGWLSPREAADAREQRLLEIQQFWRAFAEHFHQQIAGDPLFSEPGYCPLLLQAIWHDAIGYSGAALIQRVLSAEKLNELAAISDTEMQTACYQHVLTLGRTLMLAAGHIADEEALVARIRQAG